MYLPTLVQCLSDEEVTLFTLDIEFVYNNRFATVGLSGEINRVRKCYIVCICLVKFSLSVVTVAKKPIIPQLPMYILSGL